MITNLQHLRAFAALNVVLFHIIGNAQSYQYPTYLLSPLKGWGANGVDLFFVISGFVMMLSQARKNRSAWSFFKMRLVRIVPIYWVLTTAVILIYLILPGAFREMHITTEWALSSYLFVSGLVTNEHPVVYVGWTLEWEMLFYLIFGLSLLYQRLAFSSAFVSILLILIALMSSSYIILEFLAGMYIAQLYLNIRTKEYIGVLFFILGSVLLCVSIFPSVRMMSPDRLITWGVPSVMIVFGLVRVPQYRSKICETLGDASYSIYLVQIFTIPAFYKLVGVIKPTINHDLLALICLTATAIAGVLLHLLLEKPMTTFIRERVV